MWRIALVALTLATALLGAGRVHAATFEGGPLGPVPDGLDPSCAVSPGAAKDVLFDASGLTGDWLGSIELYMSFFPAHPWVGDLDVRLIAPTGESMVIFSRTGATSDSGGTVCGDNSDVAGPYLFGDDLSPVPSDGWWQEAAFRGETEALGMGGYHPTQAGGAGVSIPAPEDSMFSHLPRTADPNGIWTLRIRDVSQLYTTTINGASLTLVRLDTIRPQTSIKGKPKKTTPKRKATFKFASNEVGATFQCKLDKKSYKACKSPKTLKVKPGKHTLRVRAVDKAGNKDATPAKFGWTVTPS